MVSLCAPLMVTLLLAHSSAGTRHERAERCDRTPAGAMGKSKADGDNGFQLAVERYALGAGRGNVTPTGYDPGEMYTVKLMGRTTRYTVQTFRAFTLVALDEAGNPVGRFQPADTSGSDSGMDNSGSTGSPTCPHGVQQTTLGPKTDAHAVWFAPVEDRGCVSFRAAVLQYGNTWFMDDGDLTKRFCPAADFASRLPDDTSRQCCACDEAKYELLFDGHWSSHTHPKDFPHLVHLTHFSDILGASHSPRYTMWKFGTYASDGLKELAEWGNTYKMEREMRDKAKEIRTIIKTRGLWFPNVEGQAKATFRTDKYHHLLSLASMFGPSPDWLVGVSDINLCTADCGWSAERRFDLYPWDAGTDSGVSYMSPNNPTVPRAKIAPITTKSPADARAPFYDADEDAMPPLASLTVRRLMVYPSTCKTDTEYQVIAANASTNSEDEEYGNRRECMVGEWTPWSLCSATCGKGIRMRSRVYKFPVKAQMFNCDRQVTEKQFCNARVSVCQGSDAFNVDACATGEWTEWTDCTVTCGQGVRSRTRNYANPSASAACAVSLSATESCTGEHGGDCERALNVDPRCRTTAWSDWSPCSSSCGPGARVRTRLFHYAQHRDECEPHTELMQQDNCEVQTCQRFFEHYGPDVCELDMVVGQCHGTFPRYYYDKESNTCRRFIYTGCKGNHNQFETEEQCKKLCVKGYDPNAEALEHTVETSPPTTSTTTTSTTSSTTTATTTTTSTTPLTTPTTTALRFDVESNAIEHLAPDPSLAYKSQLYVDRNAVTAQTPPTTTTLQAYVPKLLASNDRTSTRAPKWDFHPVYATSGMSPTTPPSNLRNRYYEYRPDLGYWVPTYGHGRAEIATYVPTTTASTRWPQPQSRPTAAPPSAAVVKPTDAANDSIGASHEQHVQKMIQTSKELADEQKSATLIHITATLVKPVTTYRIRGNRVELVQRQQVRNFEQDAESAQAAATWLGDILTERDVNLMTNSLADDQTARRRKRAADGLPVPDNALAGELGLSVHDAIADGGPPVDCMVTEWSAWSDCSRTCGSGGQRVRTRAVKVFARNAGRPCPENMQQRRSCRQRPCPFPMCYASRWSPWGPCSGSCAPNVDSGAAGYPTQKRFRHVHAGHGDAAARCTLEGMQRRPCASLPPCHTRN